MDEQFLVEEVLGAGGAGGLDPLEIREVAALLKRPNAARMAPKLVAELTKIVVGLSEIDIPDRDPQYGDRAWREHPIFRRLAQSHLALAEWIEAMTEDPGAEWDTRERTRYVTNIVTSALSPANLLPTNPAAVRKAIDTAGISVLRGGRTFVNDLLNHGGMPRMTDVRPFRVGENVACSPGAVVYREEMFELIQYSPSTESVHERPLLVVPPQVGRYYILDLAPQRSLVEYAVSLGIQTLMLVWRNPDLDSRAGHGGWGIAEYMSAVERAFDVVRELAGTEDLNLLGFCAGGFTSALTLASLAQRGQHPVHAATYLVTMLDTRQPNLVTPLTTKGVNSQLNKLARKGKVIGAQTVANHFAWLRPKDLVFGHVIHNWLLGEDPSAYDLLAWNDDGANMSAKFVSDATAMMAGGELVEPGAVTVEGIPIDLSQVAIDNFIVAAQTDHITTWRPCYMTSQLLGGDSEMVVANKGHIQTVVSAIENSRQKYWAGPATASDPDEWLSSAEQFAGSWWPRWGDWLTGRSGGDVAAPIELGSPVHPAREPAPGLYVLEK